VGEFDVSRDEAQGEPRRGGRLGRGGGGGHSVNGR
jgi:hypothetical protein